MHYEPAEYINANSILGIKKDCYSGSRAHVIYQRGDKILEGFISDKELAQKLNITV